MNEQVVETGASPPECGVAALKEWSGNPSIYPNPVSEVVYLSLDSEATFEGLFTLSGTGLPVTIQDKCLDIRDLPAGMYEIRIQSEGILQHHRIIKQ